MTTEALSRSVAPATAGGSAQNEARRRDRTEGRGGKDGGGGAGGHRPNDDHEDEDEDEQRVNVCKVSKRSPKTLVYTSVEKHDLSKLIKAGGAECKPGAMSCCVTPSTSAATCTNFSSDPNNCGACGKACGTGYSCVAGACVAPCPTGQTFCGGACVQTQSDDKNCGGCGKACKPGEKSCSQGSCKPVAQTDACVPTSSLTILLPPANSSGPVRAFVPNGSWSEPATGVRVANVEGTPQVAQVATSKVVNSCASNRATGKVVCSSNDTDVYVLDGTTLALSTVQSSAVGQQSFSGGECTNCGVAIDAANNRAIVMVSTTTNGPGGYQVLDLGTNAFAPPVGAGSTTTENVLFDPFLNLVLSPNEQGIYQLFDTKTAAVLNFAIPGTPELDSAAEDCSTGIALASLETTPQLLLVDLNQKTTPTPGTWSAPSNLQTLPGLGRSSGIAVVSASHLGVLASEFGGTEFAAFKLPDHAGTGTPSVVDYAAANMPPDPSGAPWKMGADPHTVTAYHSTNTKQSLAVIANAARTYLAVVDLQALLAAPRSAGTNSVDPTANLATSGVVRFVPLQ